uniref:Pancreatic trypsin inhibitor n=1 Tax=Rhipicephalus appendiculatus TaxID=34631 RepID=A0A131YMS9_RHIAP
MLLAISFVTLLSIYPTYAETDADATYNGTYEGPQVEARIIPGDCDRRNRRCQYPASCLCPPLFGNGPRSWRRYFYNPHHRMCQPHGQRYNCNGFRSYLECEARCAPAPAAR